MQRYSNLLITSVDLEVIHVSTGLNAIIEIWSCLETIPKEKVLVFADLGDLAEYEYKRSDFVAWILELGQVSPTKIF